MSKKSIWYGNSKHTPIKALSMQVVDAILNEQFFEKEKLIEKVSTILRAFKVNAGSTKYNRIESPTDTQKRIRQIERNGIELAFWKDKVKTLIGSEKIKFYYDELDEKLIELGYLKNKNHG